MASLFGRPTAMILYCLTQEIYSFRKLMRGFNVNISPEGKKKKARFRLYCSSVVTLIISSTCLMNVFNFIPHSLGFLLRAYSFLSTYWYWLYLSLDFKAEVFSLQTHASCPLPGCSLISTWWAYDTFAQNELLLFRFLIRLDCGLWLFPRSEQLFSILSVKLSDSLLIKTENLHQT